MERITRKIVQYLSDLDKKTKQMNFVKHLKKEVETGKKKKKKKYKKKR